LKSNAAEEADLLSLDEPNTLYSSENMNNRRNRILAEARAMIRDGGYAGFSIRELATRAGVAQRTLYNAFNSKDYLIAAAIQQSHAEFHRRVQFQYSPDTIIGRLERLVRVRRREMQIKNYTVALMAIYNAEPDDSVIRQQFRDITRHSLKPLVEAISRMEYFAEGVEPAHFVERAITHNYASLTEWCNGAVPDKDMVRDAVETFLVVLVGMTQGAIEVEGRTWLRNVRLNRPIWRDLAESSAPAVDIDQSAAADTSPQD
jgi:TetR/AcrR family transcriptional regulator, cholesterol catabolism regulator